MKTSKSPTCSIALMSLLLIFSLEKIHAQEYQITFSGTGAANAFDSVMVENITQCTVKTVNPGNILNLASTLGINDIPIQSHNDMVVYPNPMEGYATIMYNSHAEGNTSIELSDISGKRILYLNEFQQKGIHNYRLSGIDKGVYILKINSGKASFSSKIICNSVASGNKELKPIEPESGNITYVSPSGTKKNGGLKSGESLVNMQYNTGDVLKLTGVSGIYQTIVMLVPSKTQTVTFNFVACTDADNNNYPVVQIGKQLWMAENLKTTKYRDGTSIQNITDNAAWAQRTEGAWCNYDNSATNDKISGKLYNAFAVENNHRLSPEGWHVATDAELTALTDTLGGWETCGFKIRERCNTLWQAPNLGATNETGFTAKPGGYRAADNGKFNSQFTTTYFWSSTEDALTPGTIFARLIYSYNNNVYKGRYHKTEGFYVRCVKD